MSRITLLFAVAGLLVFAEPCHAQSPEQAGNYSGKLNATLYNMGTGEKVKLKTVLLLEIRQDGTATLTTGTGETHEAAGFFAPGSGFISSSLGSLILSAPIEFAKNGKSVKGTLHIGREPGGGGAAPIITSGKFSVKKL